MTHHQTHRKKNYDVHQDLEMIKKAILGVSVNMKGHASQVREEVADYIAIKPFKSIGMAVLTGLFVGYVLRK